MGTAPCPGMVHSELPGTGSGPGPVPGTAEMESRTLLLSLPRYLPTEMAPVGERARNTIVLKPMAWFSEPSGQKHDLEGLSKCRFLGHILGDPDSVGLVWGLDIVSMFKQRGGVQCWWMSEVIWKKAEM